MKPTRKKNEEDYFALPPHHREAPFGSANVCGARAHNEDGAQALSFRNTSARPEAQEEGGVYCVHDGHGGIDAVQNLMTFMERQVKWPCDNLPGALPARNHLIRSSPASAMDFMLNTYQLAERLLRGETSGVVSVTALCLPGGVCFAWMGDCQGCIFTPNDGVLRIEGCLYRDAAEELFVPEKGRDNKEKAKEGRLSSAETIPHTLLDSMPLIAYGARDGGEKEEEVREDTGSTKDITPLRDFAHFFRFQGHDAPPLFFATEHAPGKERRLHATLSVLDFRAANAQHEYELARVQSRNPSLQVELCVQQMGEGATLLVDARFAESVQPTRVLGDRDMTASHGVLRQPCALWIPLEEDAHSAEAGRPDPPPRGFPSGLNKPYALLCSDGMLSGGAFPNMNAIARFLSSPMAYLHQDFYRQGHEMTERLIMAGCLPPSLRPAKPKKHPRPRPGDAPPQKYALHCEWKGCSTWRDFLDFLSTHHMGAIKGKRFRSTFIPDQTQTVSITPEEFRTALDKLASPEKESGRRTVPSGMPLPSSSSVCDNHEGYQAWVQACENSVRWLQLNTADVKGEPSLLLHRHDLNFVATVAVHMAVVMGSVDNVTLMIVALRRG